jgi:hypothetical protein
MASVPSTSSGRRAACKDRDQLNSTKHVPETSASLSTSPGAPPVGDLIRGKEARQKSQEKGPPPWRYSVLRPSVEGGTPGALPVEAQTWGKDNCDASSLNSVDAVVVTPGTSSRPLPCRSRRPHPVRCRREVSPKVGAKSPRTTNRPPARLPQSIVQKVKGLPGNWEAIVKLDIKRSQTGGPRKAAGAAAAPAGRSPRDPLGPLHSCLFPACNDPKIGCAVRETRECQSVARRVEVLQKGKSTDHDYVPGPNTARSEGGA